MVQFLDHLTRLARVCSCTDLDHACISGTLLFYSIDLMRIRISYGRLLLMDCLRNGACGAFHKCCGNLGTYSTRAVHGTVGLPQLLRPATLNHVAAASCAGFPCDAASICPGANTLVLPCAA